MKYPEDRDGKVLDPDSLDLEPGKERMLTNS